MKDKLQEEAAEKLISERDYWKHCFENTWDVLDDISRKMDALVSREKESVVGQSMCIGTDLAIFWIGDYIKEVLDNAPKA